VHLFTVCLSLLYTLPIKDGLASWAIHMLQSLISMDRFITSTDWNIAVLKMVSQTKLSGDAVVDLSKIVQVVENTMDGTSGALYAIFLNSLVHYLRQQASAGVATAKVWGTALKQASEALSRYTPAQPGDRTLIDALHPFIEVLNASGDFKKAAEASKKGAEGTKGMKASLGRTVYIGGSGFEQVPDPGAWGLSELFLGLAGVKSSEPDYEMV
jgi:dihydroxyacetone kinase